MCTAWQSGANVAGLHRAEMLQCNGPPKQHKANALGKDACMLRAEAALCQGSQRQKCWQPAGRRAVTVALVTPSGGRLNQNGVTSHSSATKIRTACQAASGTTRGLMPSAESTTGNAHVVGQPCHMMDVSTMNARCRSQDELHKRSGVGNRKLPDSSPPARMRRAMLQQWPEDGWGSARQADTICERDATSQSSINFRTRRSQNQLRLQANTSG